MLFLITATETRSTEYNTGNEWKKSNGQTVLGFLESDDYEDAIVDASNKFGVDVDNLDAYGLIAD